MLELIYEQTNELREPKKEVREPSDESSRLRALSRDRTGTGLTPLVFETNASTNSAIRAAVLTQVQS